MSKGYVELSHPIEAGMITYKGLPGPIISDHLSRADSRKNYSAGTEFFIGKIEMVANTGTYVDSPFHRYANGNDLSQIPLSSLADLLGIVVHADQRKGRAVDPGFFQNLDLSQKAVLIHTGWDKHWRTDRYAEGHPYVTRETAEFLIQSRVSLVGIDSFNIDDTADGARSAHTLLLGAGIPIVEHLCNLQALPTQGFRFFAVPPMVRAFGSFPVRAFAILM